MQYAFTPNDQLDINYIGNRGVRMVGGMNYNQLNPKYLFTAGGQPNTSFLSATAAYNPLAAPLQALEKGGMIAPSSCNIDSATAMPNYQLLLAYPQYCGVGQTDAPVGQSLYNSLQVTYNHRISKGLTALVSYTYSKFLDNVEGNNSWSYNGAANWGATANYFNLAGEKSVDAGDIPHALVASYVYQRRRSQAGCRWESKTGTSNNKQHCAQLLGQQRSLRLCAVWHLRYSPSLFIKSSRTPLPELGHRIGKELGHPGDNESPVPLRDLQLLQPSKLLCAGTWEYEFV